MSDHTTHYSTSIDESKKTGVFLGYYRPLQDSLVLNALTLKTERIWYEKNWTTSHNILFQRSIKIDSGIHFIAPYSSLLTSDMKVDIFIKADTISGQHFYNSIEKKYRLGYANTMSTRPDTFILIFGTNYGSGYKDTITYVKE
jgi:hypothetical protein